MSEKSYLQRRLEMKLGIKTSTDASASTKGVNSDDPTKKAQPHAKGPAARKTPAKPSKPAGKPGKTRSKIKKRSKKQKAIMKDLKLAYGPYLASRPYCLILSPVCTKKATCVNHKKGRGVNEVLDQRTWEPSCVPCNDYIEAHHEWAVENGHKISRHQK
jgi:hypothetical protein